MAISVIDLFSYCINPPSNDRNNQSFWPSYNASFSVLQAFRFPSTPTVNFVATVQFCQDRCDPVDCSGELTSYGRRKRSVGDNTTTSTSLSTAGPRVLPEQLMLGLRLTVGEDQVAKPHPPSRLGRGNFPEREEADVSQDNYYPAIATLGQSLSLSITFHISHGKTFQISETPAISAVPSRPS